MHTIIELFPINNKFLKVEHNLMKTKILIKLRVIGVWF